MDDWAWAGRSDSLCLRRRVLSCAINVASLNRTWVDMSVVAGPFCVAAGELSGSDRNALSRCSGGRTILERLDKVAQFVGQAHQRRALLHGAPTCCARVGRLPERLVADADGRRRVTLLSDLEPPHVERICRHLGVTWWERDLEVGQAAAAAAAPYEGQAAPVGSVRAHRLTWLKQNVRMASRYMWVDDDVVAESDEPFLPFAVTGRADAVIATATAVRCFFALDGVVVNFALMAQMDDFASEAAQARAQHILYAWMAGHPVVTVLTDLRAVWVFHWTEAAGVLCCGRAPSYRHALLWISELVSAREGQLPASLRNRVLWTDVDNAPAAHTQTNR